MKDRTYSEEEVAALLERTAELQVQTARRQEHRPGLTLEELAAVAGEAGLDPALLRQAAAELDEPGRTLFESSTGTTSTHLFVERWVPGPLVPEAWEDVVAELRHQFDTDLGGMFGMPGYGVGSAEQVGRTVEWKHTSMAGIETRVMIRPRGDGLRIRLSQRVGLGSSLAEAFIYGTILAFFSALIVGAFASSEPAGFVAFVLGLCLGVPATLYADRAWRAKKHRELEDLADRVAALVQAAPASPSAAVAEPIAGPVGMPVTGPDVSLPDAGPADATAEPLRAPTRSRS